MQSVLNPYLNFRNNARQAMEFYQTVFGGKLQMQTFKEFHASQDPSEDNQIGQIGRGERCAFFRSATLFMQMMPCRSKVQGSG
jgi:uncharacterized glyoxalase superfamily protein PhnB